MRIYAVEILAANLFATFVPDEPARGPAKACFEDSARKRGLLGSVETTTV